MDFNSGRFPLDSISLYLDMSTKDLMEDNTTQPPEVGDEKVLSEPQTSGVWETPSPKM